MREAEKAATQARTPDASGETSLDDAVQVFLLSRRVGNVTAATLRSARTGRRAAR